VSSCDPSRSKFVRPKPTRRSDNPPLQLNYPNTHPKRQQSVYLEPPRNDRDLELRRRAWWMALVFDRLVSAGGWLHAVDERDIGTELPLRQLDFDSDDIFHVGSNPQSLLAPGFFTSHPPSHTDSFLLLIKASMVRSLLHQANHSTKAPRPAVVWPRHRLQLTRQHSKCPPVSGG